MSQQQIEYIDFNKIDLDKENPRLPESFRDSDISEKEIINWLLKDASIIELMLAIGQNNFFVGEAVLVIKSNDGRHTVVEGNRRITSVKLLNNPDIADIHTTRIAKVIEATSERPTSIPCIVFDSKQEIVRYLGYRHVTGIKSWGLLAKARYLNSLIPNDTEITIDEISTDLAKSIGSKKDYVKRLLVGHKIYKIIKDNDFYHIPNLDEKTFHFNYIADSLRYENIKSFISINTDIPDPFEEYNDDSANNLEELIDWFFNKNTEHRPRVYGHSADLTSLNAILVNDDALEKFRDGDSLEDAFKHTKINSDSFHHEIKNALRSLKYAHSFIHQIEDHNENDIDVLKETKSLSKSLYRAIEAKEEDE